MTNLVEYVLNMRGNLPAGLDNANSSAKRLNNTMDSVKGSVMSLGAAMGVTFGVAGIGMFISKVVQAGSVVENATIGLTTLLKDQVEAAQVIKNTMEDATKTPFSFEGLLAANKALISADVSAKQARTDVLNLANAIAATGGGNDELQRMVVNLQQIKNTGVATALDIKQFAYAGVNVYKVLEAAGVKTGEGIKITYEQLTKALDKAHQQGGIYFNGLENMAQSTSVKISNIGDALFQTFNDIFVEVKPLIDEVLNGVLDGISAIKNNIKPIKDFIVGIKSDTEGWMVYVNELKDLIINYIWPYFQNIFVTTTGIARDIWQFVQHSTILKDQFKWIMEFAKAVFQVINFIVDAVKMIWEYGVKPIANAIENVYRWIQGIKGTKIEADISWKNATDYASGFNKGGESEGNKSLIPGKNGLIPSVGSKESGTTTPAPKTKAEGQKTINIHVAYNAPLIQGFTISTTNIKEGLESLKEKVSAILVGATHDTLMVADY